MVPDPDDRQPIRRWARARSAGQAALAALAVLGASHLVARAGLQVQDTPAHHPAWIDDGLAPDRASGAASIRGGQLRIGAGPGVQGVRWREPLALAALEVSVLCPADRHLDIWFGEAGQGRLGVRLSRRDRLPSAWWVQAPGGLESELREFYPPRMVDWTRVQVRFDDDGAFEVAIDGRQVLRARGTLSDPGTFGFRGGGGEVLLDDLRIETRGGAVTADDFSNHEREGRAYALSLLLLLGLGAAAGRVSGSSSRYAPAIVLALGVGVGAWGVEQLHSRVAQADPPDSMGTDAAALTDALATRFARPGPPGGRVLFLGTGQTRGAGASDVGRGWVEQVCVGLNAQVPSEPAAFECVNGGLVGSSSAELWKLYRDQWSKLAPDLVIANWGHDDADPDVLRTHAERLVAFNQQRGVATWFLIEPSASDDPPPARAASAEVLRAVSREHGLPPPSELPGAVAEGGRGKHLWWALGSPTDEGHQLIARRVLADGGAVVLAVRAASQPHPR